MPESTACVASKYSDLLASPQKIEEKLADLNRDRQILLKLLRASNAIYGDTCDVDESDDDADCTDEIQQH